VRKSIGIDHYEYTLAGLEFALRPLPFYMIQFSHAYQDWVMWKAMSARVKGFSNLESYFPLLRSDSHEWLGISSTGGGDVQYINIRDELMTVAYPNFERMIQDLIRSNREGLPLSFFRPSSKAADDLYGSVYNRLANRIEDGSD